MNLVIRTDDPDLFENGLPLPPAQLREMIAKKKKLEKSKAEIMGEKEEKTLFGRTRQDAAIEALEKKLSALEKKNASLEKALTPQGKEKGKPKEGK